MGKSSLLGSKIESVLNSLGITAERVTKWLGRPCDCIERKRKLNRLHVWLIRAIRYPLSAKESLDELLDSNAEEDDA